MKKSIFNKITAITLTGVMLVGTMLNGNLLKVSAAETSDNLALNKPVSVSGLEVNDGRFTADKAVDGVVSKESRVSFAKTADEQWLCVDLEKEMTVSNFVINYESQAPSFKIQVSTDGANYTDVYIASGIQGQVPGVQKIAVQPVKARYVKYVQLERWTHSGNGQKYSGSIYEFEVYGVAEEQKEEQITASTVLKAIAEEAPLLSEDKTKVILPEVPEGFEVSLYGCDAKQVVDIEGNVILPIQDMKVNVLYQVKNLNEEGDIAKSDKDISFIVPGITTPSENDNEKPNVVPGLREWKGYTGEFALTETSKIIYEEGLEASAVMIQSYFKDMLERTVEIEQGTTPKAGDIFLKNGETVKTVGEEGYLLEINDYVTITAPTYVGMIYGGASITQILYQDNDRINAPKGIARDYPKYDVRAGMIDVGRVYIPLEYLKEMATYMSWFKLNEIQVHINDYWGKSKYSAFRLESETYPLINAKDGYYTKNEYRQFQKDLKKRGIDVVTEIDTPYHSEAFRPYAETGEVVMNGAGSLDITTEANFNKNAEFIENLIDEYVDGQDPVIQSDKFHIGTDEYNRAYSEQMRKWTDHFINYVNGKGKETRLWGSLGSRGFNGITPVSNKATVNLWAAYWSDIQETFDAGYDIINTEGGWLYIVPGANAGYPDRYDIKKIYERFEVNNYASDRSGCGKIMPVAHPQTKGASFAVWNDMTSFGGGFSEFDIFDRFKDAVTMVAEKTWYGNKTEGQTTEQYMERVSKVQKKVPGANPARFVESKTDNIATIEFEKVKNNRALDSTENGHNAVLKNVALKSQNGNKVAVLDGDGYISMPFKSVGYPYTALIEVKLEEDTPENTILFEGEDGVLYANIDGTGKLGFARGNYQFTFDYEIPKNEWVKLAFTGDAKNTTLYVNGKMVSVGQNMAPAIDNRKDSNTFILPVEKIGVNLKGSIDNLYLFNCVLSAGEINEIYGADALVEPVRENIALNKKASASSYYAGHQTPDKAFDGIINPSVPNPEQSRWASQRTDDQWLAVDLGRECSLDKMVITWENAYAKNYEILYSLDNKNWEILKDVTKTSKEADVFDNLGEVKARYLKIHCTKQATIYGYSIFEVEVYESPVQDVLHAIAKMKKLASKLDTGTEKGQISQRAYDEYISSLDRLAEEVSMKETLVEEEVVAHKQSMIDELKKLKQQINEKTIYKVTVVNGTGSGEYEYDQVVTVKADALEGKVFAGWKADGKVISTAAEYTFYVSGNIILEAVYDEALETKLEAFVTNVITTQREDGKYDVKFVGQLVLPEGYIIETAGLVWSSKGETELILGTGLKPTCITKISETNQFSVTIKGMPEGKFLRGKIFVIANDGTISKTIYSDEKVSDPEKVLK